MESDNIMKRMAQKMELWDINNLIPYEKNARTHSDNQINQIAKSIEEFGFNNPILIDSKSGIIAGHGRLLAAKMLGINKVPVVILDHLNDAQKRAYIIADNKLALNAGWDEDILKMELESLKIDNFDLSLIGFDENELREIMPEENSSEADDEVPDERQTEIKIGDMFKLGDHKLLCGDCTVKENVEKLMGGEKADMVLTDPPYGIKRDEGFKDFEGLGGFGPPIKRRQYQDSWDGERPSKSLFDLLLGLSKKIIIFGGNFFADLLPQGKHWLVWDKKNTMPTFGDCELAWTNIERASVKKYEVVYNGLIGKEKERFHPTQKPVILFEKIITDYSDEHNTIVDLFGGSGSTLIACEKTNRKCFMMELDPQYCQVIIDRWEKFTGKKVEKWN